MAADARIRTLGREKRFTLRMPTSPVVNALTLKYRDDSGVWTGTLTL